MSESKGEEGASRAGLIEQQTAAVVIGSVNSGACGSTGLSEREAQLVDGSHGAFVPANKVTAKAVLEATKNLGQKSKKELAAVLQLPAPIEHRQMMDLCKRKRQDAQSELLRQQQQNDSRDLEPRKPNKGAPSLLWLLFKIVEKNRSREGSTGRILQCEIMTRDGKCCHQFWEPSRSSAERRKHLRNKHQVKDFVFNAMTEREVRALCRGESNDEWATMDQPRKKKRKREEDSPVHYGK